MRGKHQDWLLYQSWVLFVIARVFAFSHGVVQELLGPLQESSPGICETWSCRDLFLADSMDLCCLAAPLPQDVRVNAHDGREASPEGGRIGGRMCGGQLADPVA